jgi:hypothetical protein
VPLSKQLVRKFNEAQSQLVVQTADLPLGTLAEMVESGAIDLKPGFQRRERWTPEKQSALIESFLLNVPVPPIYLAEEDDGTYTAIDGKQRLRAISDFIENRFALRKLERLIEAEGFRFETLPSELVNPLKLRPFLRVVTLLKQSHPALKYEVFLRLNRGGETLNAQEIRNVAFRGSLNNAVYELSENSFLKKQLKIHDNKSTSYRDMSDAEFVLRFLTLYDRLDVFSGSLVREMDEYMEKNQRMNAAQIKSTKGRFNTAILRCQQLWGPHAFKRPDGPGWRDQMLAGMYDAQMLSAALVSEKVFKKASTIPEAVLGATRDLFNDQEFEEAVRVGTNTPARIKYRVTKMRVLLQTI